MTKVTDFNVIVILLMVGIYFLIMFFSFFVLLIIPFLLYLFFGLTFTLSVIIFILLLLIVYVKYPNIFTDSFKLIYLFVVALSSLGYIVILCLVGQSILSTFFPNNIFYDKSNYQVVLFEYIERFSGYPKIVTLNNKEYYVPISDSNYYYVYDIEDVKNRYLSDLQNEKMSKKLNSICKNEDTQKMFQKNYIVDNPYIKPKFLNEKIDINNKDIKLKEINFERLITLEDIKMLCKK